MARRRLAGRGVFVTFEGPEGSGKSSQIARLAGALKAQGWRVIVVRDPGSTRLGAALRRVLLETDEPLTPLAEALLFIGARVQLVEERIRPALARGSVVLCDRFHDATVAYQGFGGGLEVAWLDRYGRQAVGHVMPDVTLFLDVPVEVGFGRLRRSHDRMERKARQFHRRVLAGYRRLARREPRRIIRVDASRPAAAVQADLARVMAAVLEPR